MQKIIENIHTSKNNFKEVEIFQSDKIVNIIASFCLNSTANSNSFFQINKKCYQIASNIRFSFQINNELQLTTKIESQWEKLMYELKVFINNDGLSSAIEIFSNASIGDYIKKINTQFSDILIKLNKFFEKKPDFQIESQIVSLLKSYNNKEKEHPMKISDSEAVLKVARCIENRFDLIMISGNQKIKDNAVTFLYHTNRALNSQNLNKLRMGSKLLENLDPVRKGILTHCPKFMLDCYKKSSPDKIFSFPVKLLEQHSFIQGVLDYIQEMKNSNRIINFCLSLPLYIKEKLQNGGLDSKDKEYLSQLREIILQTPLNTYRVFNDDGGKGTFRSLNYDDIIIKLFKSDREIVNKILESELWETCHLMENLYQWEDLYKLFKEKFIKDAYWLRSSVPCALQHDKDAVQQLVNKNFRIFFSKNSGISYEFRNDPDIILTANNASLECVKLFTFQDFMTIVDYWDKNKEIECIKKAIKIDFNTYNYLSIKTQRQPWAILQVLNSNGLYLEKFPSLKDNVKVVTTAIQNNGIALKFASDRLRNNVEIVKLAIKNNYLAFNCASVGLRLRREIQLEVLKMNGLYLQYFPLLKEDLEAVAIAANNNMCALQFVPNDLRNTLFTIPKLGNIQNSTTVSNSNQKNMNINQKRKSNFDDPKGKKPKNN